MNNSTWLSLVRSVTTKKAGRLLSQDSFQLPVVIDWHITDIVSPDLASFKKEVSDLAAQVTAASEVELLQEYPQAVHTGGFFKSCEALVVDEMTDWSKVEESLRSSIKQFYTMDILLFGQEVLKKLEDDLYFFASIKDQKTGRLLGFLMSSITPALPYGDIKIINLVVQPNSQEAGLEKLLLASVLKVLPVIKRMFVMARPTNMYAIEQYLACGFERDENPVQDPHHVIDVRYLSVFEYKTEISDIVQMQAELLQE